MLSFVLSRARGLAEQKKYQESLCSPMFVFLHTPTHWLLTYGLFVYVIFHNGFPADRFELEKRKGKTLETLKTILVWSWMVWSTSKRSKLMKRTRNDEF